MSKTLYVSILIGDNSNDGSINAPYKTIQKAINILNFGDTCVVLQGTYYESLQFKQSGTLDKPIVLKSYPNHKVVVKNLFTKNNWIHYDKNIYKTTNNTKILQAFFDDLPEMQATFPTIKEGLLSKNQWLDSYANTNKTINLSQNFKMKENENVRFCGVFGNGLIAIGGKVIEKANNVITIENDSWYWGNNYLADYLGSGKCFLTGSLDFLDTEGEWYSDSNYIYTIPKNNDTSNLSKIEFRNEFYVLSLKNQKNIIIQGINFFGGSIDMSNCENIKLDLLTVEYIMPYFNFTYGYTENYNNLDKTGSGILISGKNNSITNSTITNSWGDGITIFGENHSVTNCIIKNCDWMGIDCAPLYLFGRNHLIDNNTIKYCGRSGIRHDIQNSKIRKNYFSNFGLLNNDLGAIYCYGTNGENTEISYNYITKSKAKNGIGIYIDNGCKNYTVHHNIVSNCNVGLTLNKPGENYKIYNNTLYNNNFSMGSWGPEGNNLINVYTFNNLTDNDNRLKWNYKAYYGSIVDSNYIYKSAVFNDAINGDFRLKPNSYPIDKGVITNETKLFLGKLPDLGAIEFNSEPIFYGSSLQQENTKNGIPLPPLNLTLLKKESNKIHLGWEYPYSLIDQFVIKRKLSNDSYTEIGRINGNLLEFIDTLKNIGEYRYQVFGVNKNGISDESNSIEIFYDIHPNSLFINAENCDLQRGIVVEKDKITYVDNKDWILFSQINLNDYNRCKTRYAVPCDNAGQEIQFRIDKPMGKIVGKFNTNSTSSFDSLKIFEYPIDTINGIHDVYIKFRGTYGIGNFDWFELFSSKDSIIQNYNDVNCVHPEGMQSFYSSITFPNPTISSVTVSYYYNSTSTIEIEVVDQLGVKYLSYNSDFTLSGTSEINIPEFEYLKQGIYFVKTKITSKNKTIEEKTHKVIKL